MSHNHLKFNKPAFHLVSSIGKGLPPLELEGEFPDAIAKKAYVGTINVLNAVGKFTVKMTFYNDITYMGGVIRADNENSTVEVSWPEYTENDASIPNFNFEDGFKGWEAGPGWHPTTENTISGNISAGYVNQGGYSPLSSITRYVVEPNTTITAKCLVRQGASSAGNAGANVRLEFRDFGTKNVIKVVEGNEVMSASKNAVYPSQVTAESPNVRCLVNIGARGIRHKQNKEVWVDSFEWDYKVPASGVFAPEPINLQIEVTDSIGRSASGFYEIRVRADIPYKAWTGPISGSTQTISEFSFGTDSFSNITPVTGAYDYFASDNKGFVVIGYTSSPTQKLSFNGGEDFVNSTTNAGTGVVMSCLKTDANYFWSIGSGVFTGQIIKRNINSGAETKLFDYSGVGPVTFNGAQYAAFSDMGNYRYARSVNQGASFSNFDTSPTQCVGLLASNSDLIRIVKKTDPTKLKFQKYISDGNWVDLSGPDIETWSGWATIRNIIIVVVSVGPNSGVYVFDPAINPNGFEASVNAPLPAVPKCGPQTGGVAGVAANSLYVLGNDGYIYKSNIGTLDWFGSQRVESMPSPTSFCIIDSSLVT